MKELYTDKEMFDANKTDRSESFGLNAIIPRYVTEYINKDKSILDFGSGRTIVHTRLLRNYGYKDITPYDFGLNCREGVHDKDALNKEYDCVYSSNVLNVQSSKEMLNKTLNEIYSVLKYGGYFICNFPDSPRKCKDIDELYIITEIKKKFLNTQIVGGTKKAPVILAEK